MIVPYKQTPNFSDLDSETRLEIMNLIDLSMQALMQVLSPHGFNVGLNLGSVAGGSVDSHIHFHGATLARRYQLYAHHRRYKSHQQ